MSRVGRSDPAKTPGFTAALLALPALEPATQAVLAELLVRREDWQALSRLAHLGNLTDEVDAYLATVSAAPVRAAWITRPYRDTAIQLAALADEHDPYVLATVLELNLRTPGRPAPEVFALVAGHAATVLPEYVLACDEAGEEAWAAAGAALAGALDAELTAQNRTRDPSRLLRVPCARKAFAEAATTVASVRFALRLDQLSPTLTARYVLIIAAAFDALTAALEADPQHWSSEEAHTTRVHLSAALQLACRQPWCTPAQVAMLRAAHHRFTTLLAADPTVQTYPFEAGPSETWRELVRFPTVLLELREQVAALVHRAAGLTSELEFRLLWTELELLYDELTELDLNDVLASRDEHRLAHEATVVYEQLLTSPHAALVDRDVCARRILATREGAGPWCGHVTAGDPVALAALAVAGYPTIGTPHWRWTETFVPLLTPARKPRFVQAYLELVTEHRAGYAPEALTELFEDEEAFALSLELVSVAKLEQLLRDVRTPPEIKARYAAVLERELAGEPALLWLCVEEFAPGFGGTFAELMATCRATLA